MPLEYRSVLAIYILFSPGKGKPENIPTRHNIPVPSPSAAHSSNFLGSLLGVKAMRGQPGLCEMPAPRHFRTSASMFRFPHNPPRSGLTSADA
jgi:hypothetical protein